MQTDLWQNPVGEMTPRDYQAEDHRNSFRLWDAGEVGVLTRGATGCGKTFMACLKMRTWLDAGDDHRCMVLSYEKELVRQFAQEIKDVLGNKYSIGIEMGTEEIMPTSVPQIVVASRQSLMTHELATDEQRETLREFGFSDVRLLTKSAAKRSIAALQKDVDIQSVADEIDALNADYRANHDLGRYSRLYKFDHRLNWLLIMDEAHKYSMKLRTVGHLVEWFEQNPKHRRNGITATPKRRDKVSIGTKLFPGIALDFPLTRAIKEGYAVPYIQKFIQVESIDFRAISAAFKGVQEKIDRELDRILNTEKELARLCEPLLDLSGTQSTLIFSPTVEMAQNVTDYINARCECECPSCGTRRWYPNLRIGDGVKCRECDDFIESKHIVRGGTQSHCLWGSIPEHSRREIYRKHKEGEFQFLSVCGLCREGYNDPNISCVAIFRMVSKAASSLAEQMKGRGCRTLKGVIDDVLTAEERCAAIAASAKPVCTIIDLVGVSGLADCASTIQIYADGLPDEIIARAEEIALAGGVPDPMAAIEQAQREDAEEKERIRIAREAAEQRRRDEAAERARMDAEATYSVHEVGTAVDDRDPSQPSLKMIKFIRFLGIEFIGWEPSRAQAKRMIGQLQAGESIKDVIYSNGIADEQWKRAIPSRAQANYVRRLGYSGSTRDWTPKQMSDAIGNLKSGKPVQESNPFKDKILATQTHGELSELAREIKRAFDQGSITKDIFENLIKIGQQHRSEIF